MDIIGDWGLGIGDWAQSPIPNPQSPIPNPHELYPKNLILMNKKINHNIKKITIQINKNQNKNILILLNFISISQSLGLIKEKLSSVFKLLIILSKAVIQNNPPITMNVYE